MLPHSATTSVRDESSKDKSESPRRAPYPFTQLPNALYVLLPRLDGSETKVLWVILRRTFGFQEYDRPAAIGLSMFERETGLARETVVRALNALASRGLVERIGEGTQRRRYRVIIPGPVLVRKCDQQLVQKSDQQLVGNPDHLKESSSKQASPKKKSCVRSEFNTARRRVTNVPERGSFLVDDDAAVRISKPPEGLSPEQELNEIVREKTGLPLHLPDFCRIRENLELRNITLE